MLMIDYSIIIPTHNRHNLMQKNIEYFSIFKNCQIYICDSTDNIYEYEFPVNITYIHMPKKSFVQKMNLILENVETDYVAVCADDDFIIEDTVNEILEKLNHKNYAMGIGRYFGFDIPFNTFYPIYTQVNFSTINYKNSNDRLIKYMKNYYMSLWAVYNKNILKKAYDILNKVPYINDNFIELVISITCANDNSIYFSNNILGIRECKNIYNTSWKHKQKNLLEYSLDNRGNFLDTVKKFDSFFDNNIFSKGINVYLKTINKKNKIKRIKNKINSKIYFFKYSSTFHNDKILEIILNSNYGE
ncbi:TIGR00180 family glycosyltransferase [Aliarcobacter butzleri]|uniref:TIGR00180 family glycosyltransferase n=1 Tax=Aliarcobacter butzleri TaxID=28197 RepID=UPI001EDAF5DA|nr:TIGR00180 family glycosyltransferase [Aliarcobacter butzleri]MCG3679260.1 TIGR00180 family glycosyltransferase [Aliarcobacter butzleri]